MCKFINLLMCPSIGPFYDDNLDMHEYLLCCGMGTMHSTFRDFLITSLAGMLYLAVKCFMTPPHMIQLAAAWIIAIYMLVPNLNIEFADDRIYDCQ